jgi:hypothetical protein
MNKMKTISTLILSGLLIFSASLMAQVDETRMDKDLRVAATVLESLAQGEDQGYVMYNDNVEANYVEGYGVIFTIGGGYSFYMGRGRMATSYGSGGSTVIVAPKAEKDGDKEEQEKEEIEEVDLSEIMVEFLVDYSQMINQLSPDDKIMVSTKKSDYVYVGRQSGTNFEVSQQGNSGITAEMMKKDHNDFLAGKLSREKLIERIEINKDNGDKNRTKDLDLFASMLSTVYDDEYTDTYFMSWKPEYQRLTGVGAIYSFKVYSSYDEDGWYRMPGADKKGLNSEQRNAEVEKMYPVFVKSMKANIVQYGRTITSLEPDEMLLLKVTLTKCDGCSIPKKIQFSVKQADLTAFKTGKISEKEAIAKVTVTDL